MKHVKKLNLNEEFWSDYEIENTIKKPKSVDMAAQDYAEDIKKNTKYSESLIHLTEAFKAGAKWVNNPTNEAHYLPHNLPKTQVCPKCGWEGDRTANRCPECRTKPLKPIENKK